MTHEWTNKLLCTYISACYPVLKVSNGSKKTHERTQNTYD